MISIWKRVPLAAALALGIAGCGGGPAARNELPAPPSIRSFEADKTRINLGEAVTLTWTVDGATSLELLDDAGNKLDPGADLAAGSVELTPARSTFFVLRARGEGGRDAAFVQVAVSEDLQEAFLLAVPPEITSGEPALLLWSAQRARQARIQSASGQLLPLDAQAGGGTLEVTPARTAVYSLVASGVDPEQSLTRTAEIKVRPRVEQFSLSAGAAKVAEDLTVSWKTRGAGEVVVSEATFGELARVSFPAQTAQVDQGGVTFTVPATLPSGEAVLDGHPLKFTLVVQQTHPAVTLTRQLHGHVGEGPAVLQFAAPVAVTEGGTLELSWVTRNAERLQLYAGGALIHEPLPGQREVVERGSLVLPAPPAETIYELRAFSHAGAQVSASRTVKVVKAPQVSTFTLPASVNAPGDAANATWTTVNATRAFIRVKHGATVSVVGASQVQSGITQVYPGVGTTYVFEAYNDAGQVATVERTVQVLGGAPVLTAGPTPVTSGQPVTVTWAFPAGLAAAVMGDPTAPFVKNNPATEWLDLSLHTGAQPLLFENDQDGVAKLPLTVPFRFPFVNLVAEGYWVSTNGWVAFRKTQPLPVNEPLGSTTGGVPMLAPFWDDLELGTGQVLWVVEGSTFPRRLIIQWDGVRTAADPQSALTFQVQLRETGEAHFIYQAMSGQDSGGEGASIGWWLGSDLFKELATAGAATVAPGDELAFFGSGAEALTWDFIAHRPGTVSPFLRTAQGRYVSFSSRVNVIAPGSVTINEAMVVADPSALEGQWVELYNGTDEPVELGGTILASLGTSTEWTIPEDTVVPARGYRVVGQSTDPQVNGDAPVDVAWSDLAVAPVGDDTLTLSAVNPIATFGWTGTALVSGQSVQAAEKAITSGGSPLACTRTQTFNAAGAIGTPGAKNETCYDYTLSQVPLAWRDISTSGQSLFAQGVDDAFVQIQLPGGVPFFGQPQTTAWVSSNGFLAFSPITSSHLTNKTAPGTAAPRSTVAPFWDDLEDYSGQGKVLFARMAPGADPTTPAGHWVIQWHNLSHFDANDDLNFQVKLFDDGLIELHFADMVSGSSDDRATGNSATVWLEHPNGASALPVGINQAVLQPNTAYRFTPKP
jgi:hypothetical protein